jgi:DNA-directed RNA polymerase specialized sigma24 family protein
VSRRPGERFRGWLFTALRSFLKNQWEYDTRQRRDVRQTVHLVSEGDRDERGLCVSDLADTTPDPEQRLGRAQALTLLATVLGRLRRDYCANARAAGVDGERRFDAIKVFLAGPNTEAADYSAVAHSLGLSSDTVRQLVHRQRERLAILLDEELAKGASSADDVASTKRRLRQALSRSSKSDAALSKRGV